jgi:hypothetical protein
MRVWTVLTTRFYLVSSAVRVDVTPCSPATGGRL